MIVNGRETQWNADGVIQPWAGILSSGVATFFREPVLEYK